MKIDKKDAMILNLLQKNCRMSLTKISKEINLSIDSTKKRINKLLKNQIFYPRIQLRLRHLDFNNIVEVKIKMKNPSEEAMDNFIENLKANPFVSEIFSITGEWDLSIVIVSRDSKDLIKISTDIRQQNKDIINEWSETVTSRVHKFEMYDVVKLLSLED